MKKIIIFCAILGILILSCGNSNQVKEENKVVSTPKEGIEMYLDTLKSENTLKITRGGYPLTVVGKELKVGDKIKEIPLTVNTELEDRNIFEDKAIKVLYTAPSLDTKVCSIQTRMLNDAA